MRLRGVSRLFLWRSCSRGLAWVKLEPLVGHTPARLAITLQSSAQIKVARSHRYRGGLVIAAVKALAAGRVTLRIAFLLASLLQGCIRCIGCVIVGTGQRGGFVIRTSHQVLRVNRALRKRRSFTRLAARFRVRMAASTNTGKQATVKRLNGVPRADFVRISQTVRRFPATMYGMDF